MACSFLEYVFVIEIFTFLCYANGESDDVIDGSTKTVQHSINNISRNIKAEFFKLRTRNVHHKFLSCCHGNTLGPSLFLWKTKYPHFQLFKVRQRVLPRIHMVPILS